ncbi:Predicted membrane protein [Granulicella rosea]|uniref:Predicted membrane protein n=1 Tax=Granulicella rosea TaxID=474952 RepID=A0A239CST0_9BACT|nr:DUF2339 domain-containing protein [Granulicella rosea]SNS22443.1 Predicted membrane protein [Granulicella rosea]
MDLPEPEQKPERTATAAELAALTARVAWLERQLAELQGPASRPAPRAPVVPAERESRETPPPPPTIPFAAKTPPPQSLENRLGSQVFSRVGIVAVLIGVAAFLKLAVDNGWLNPTPMTRLLAGLAVGTGVVLWSERFRRKGFPAFSYALKAVGTGVLYLSLWAAFQMYHLLPAPVALGMMILVTAWNAWMAWVQDAELLAGYALIGAMATPALLSTGGDHELFLFTYLAAIDLGVVALLRVKPWSRLLLGCVPVTFVYYAGWYALHYREDSFGLTAFFIAVFFTIFHGPSLGDLPADAAKRAPGETLRLVLALANAGFTTVAAYALLDDASHRDMLPWVMVVLAAVYLGLMRLQRNAATAGVSLSLAVVFLTVAIPLKASGRWITVGWLVEGVALLALSSRLSRAAAMQAFADGTSFAAYRLLRLLGLGALALGFAGVMSLPWWLYREPQTTLANARFATALVGIAAFALTVWIASRAEEADLAPSIPEMNLWPVIAALGVVAINLIALQAGILEIVTYWGGTAPLAEALSISGYLMLYGAGLLAVGFSQRSAFLRWQALGLLLFTIGKTFLYDVRSLSEGYRVASFLGLGALLMGISFAYQKDWLGLKVAESDVPTQPEGQP